MSNKTQLVHNIGLEILEAKALIGKDWNSLALVVDLGENHFSQSGFLYFKGNGEPFTAISKQRRKLSSLCKELKDLMSCEFSIKVSQMLIQIERDKTKVNIEFGDNTNSKWSITPSNIDEIKNEIKPNFQ